MKTINTLIPDIYKVVGSNEGWFNGNIAEDFSRELNLKLVERAKPKSEVSALRLSKMGEHCPCQLWHSVHTPELAERPQPHALIKFTYGDILETLVIALAKAAGHEVTGEQDELILDGVKGHRDCVIDGCTVDVKSVNSLGFQKVKAGLVATDPFLRDYLDQLDGYTVAAYEDPLVRVKDKAYIVFIDKVLGKLALYEHRVTIERVDRIHARIAEFKQIIGRVSPPACTCESVPEGKSGNYRLGTKASYNPYKFCCNPQLRCFLYADGPKYLTRVVRKPDVIEVDRNGKVVYN